MIHDDLAVPVRSYSKQQLATLYFPAIESVSAVRTLMTWIRRNKQLADLLMHAGYNMYQKMFTPAQVNLIFEYLGEPG